MSAEKRYASDAAITALKQDAADRLRSAAQFFDPFKFITYGEMIGRAHKPMPTAGGTRGMEIAGEPGN